MMFIILLNLYIAFVCAITPTKTITVWDTDTEHYLKVIDLTEVTPSNHLARRTVNNPFSTIGCDPSESIEWDGTEVLIHLIECLPSTTIWSIGVTPFRTPDLVTLKWKIYLEPHTTTWTHSVGSFQSYATVGEDGIQVNVIPPSSTSTYAVDCVL